MELTTARDNYLDHCLLVEKNKKSTMACKTATMHRLLRWLAANQVFDTTELTQDLMRRYAAEDLIPEKGVAQTTANTYMGTIRHFLKYLAKKKLLGEDQDPGEEMRNYKQPKAPRKRLWVREEEMWGYANRAMSYHPRDWFVVVGSFFLARRITELLNMKVGDIDRRPRPGYAEYGVFSFFQDKTGEVEEELPLEPEFRPHLDRWLDSIYPTLLGRELRPEDALVPGLQPVGDWVTQGYPTWRIRTRKGFATHTTYSTIWEHLGELGIPTQLHAFRRGAAEWYQETYDGDMRVATTMLGHKAEATTERYLRRTRRAQDLGKRMSERQARAAAAAQGRPAPETAAEVRAVLAPGAGSGVSDLAAARARRARSGSGRTA